MAEVKGNLLVQDKLTVDGNADFNKGLDSSYLEINDTKAKGTVGGSFSPGSWKTRDLTTLIHDSLADSVTLGSNQFVIPSGTYHIEASVPAYKVDAHKGRLADVTDFAGTFGVTVKLGTTEKSGASDTTQTRSFIEGRFSVSRSTTLEIQHYCETENAVDGFGSRANFYVVSEVYTSMKMWQISKR